MDTVTILDPSQRQVLVVMGNRYVVFGPSAGLPEQLQFDPLTDSEVLPRIADDAEIAGERIAQTLRVAGMERSQTPNGVHESDVELIDADGSRILVDIKVKERDPKQRDLEQGSRRLEAAARAGQRFEIWYFNIERLKLLIMHRDGVGLRIDELVPLNVWETTAEGVFTRDRVIDEVEDWLKRVVALYNDVQAWLFDRPEVRFEKDRTVAMSEEMMQQFAVPEREVAVLDIFEADHVIASFVPRGLWLIGAWGRIDIITRDRTYVLVALKGAEKLEWRLVSPESRARTRAFNKNALLTLVGQQ